MTASTPLLHPPTEPKMLLRGTSQEVWETPRGIEVRRAKVSISWFAPKALAVVALYGLRFLFQAVEAETTKAYGAFFEGLAIAAAVGVFLTLLWRFLMEDSPEKRMVCLVDPAARVVAVWNREVAFSEIQDLILEPFRTLRGRTTALLARTAGEPVRIVAFTSLEHARELALVRDKIGEMLAAGARSRQERGIDRPKFAVSFSPRANAAVVCELLAVIYAVWYPELHYGRWTGTPLWIFFALCGMVVMLVPSKRAPRGSSPTPRMRSFSPAPSETQGPSEPMP
jgi:hypothetical protein